MEQNPTSILSLQFTRDTRFSTNCLVTLFLSFLGLISVGLYSMVFTRFVVSLESLIRLWCEDKLLKLMLLGIFAFSLVLSGSSRNIDDNVVVNLRMSSKKLGPDIGRSEERIFCQKCLCCNRPCCTFFFYKDKRFSKSL